MAGRQTFFSFHYSRDVWRASQVRNCGIVDAQARAGWNDASIWEAAKKQGDDAIKALIDTGLSETSVTVVLIGKETADRQWVRYEGRKSIDRGNGLLGVRIHMLKDNKQSTDTPGPLPALLSTNGYPVYAWDRDKFGAQVEKAAVAAGKPCLPHGKTNCPWCG